MSAQVIDFIKNAQLRSYNTMAVQAHAELMMPMNHNSKLAAVSDFYQDNPYVPLHIWGEGSNILITKDIPGLVVINQLKGVQVLKQDAQYVWLNVAAGENWHDLVSYCVVKGWGGIENLALIPGTVGAAPVQNIGAYGVELADCLQSLQVFDLSSASMKNFSNDDCQFGYRNSYFKKNPDHPFIITDITLRLSKQPRCVLTYKSLIEKLGNIDVQSCNIKDVMQAVMSIRRCKLPNPNVLANTGSFFKNPWVDDQQLLYMQSILPELTALQQSEFSAKKNKISAARLIEYCGWKGCRKYRCGVYDKHALVLVNYSQTNGLYIKKLADQIIKSVYNTFKISLEAEVNIL